MRRIASVAVILWGVLHLLCRGLVPIDFDVYRQGGLDILHHTGRLYLLRPALPFTYPPFAGLLFTPEPLLPAGLSAVAMELLSCIALVYITSRFLNLIGADHLGETGPAHRWLILLGASSLMCCLNPVWETVAKGQVNLILMAVCLLGLTQVGHSGDWRSGDRRFLGGVLVGMCGGVKLTPLALGLIPLKQRDWRFIAGMACGFVGSIALGVLLLPAESRLYWAQLAWDPARTGNVGFAANISLNGVIHRMVPGHEAAQIIWIIAVVVTIIAGYIAMPKHPRGGNAEEAPTPMSPSTQVPTSLSMAISVGVGATVMLLISPVSWNHHWVWLPFIVVWAATVVTGRTARWLLGLFLAPIAVLGPLVICRASGIGENHPWNPLVWYAGSAMPLAALVVLVTAAITESAVTDRSGRVRGVRQPRTRPDSSSLAQI